VVSCKNDCYHGRGGLLSFHHAGRFLEEGKKGDSRFLERHIGRGQAEEFYSNHALGYQVL